MILSNPRCILVLKKRAIGSVTHLETKMLDFIRRWWINTRPIPSSRNEALESARSRMRSIRDAARRGGYTSLSGITVEQLAEEIRKAKVCAICGRTNKLRRGKTKVALSVDHHHGNGRFRGMLCAGCNRGIGFLNDDPELIREAADYLEKPIVYVR